MSCLLLPSGLLDNWLHSLPLVSNHDLNLMNLYVCCSFWESIFACIEVGGDTDTVAACAGALAGAYAGLEAIESARPDTGHVLSAIQDSSAPNTADVPALRRLAAGLHAVVCGSGDAKL